MNYNHNSIVLFEKYAKKYGLTQVSQQYFIRDLIYALIIKHNISLRGVQKIIRIIEIYKHIKKHNCFIENCFPGYIIIVIMSIFISAIDKCMSQNIINNIIDENSILNFMNIGDERINDMIRNIINMIKLGDNFHIDRTDFEFDEKIEKYSILWGHFYSGMRGEVNARKILIDTISLLNLYE